MDKVKDSTVALNRFYVVIVVLGKMIGTFCCNRSRLLWIIRYTLVPRYPHFGVCLDLTSKHPILLHCPNFRTTRLLLFPRSLNSVKLFSFPSNNLWRHTILLCKNRQINAAVMFVWRLVTWCTYPQRIYGYLQICPRNSPLCSLDHTLSPSRLVLFLIVLTFLLTFSPSTMCSMYLF